MSDSPDDDVPFEHTVADKAPQTSSNAGRLVGLTNDLSRHTVVGDEGGLGGRGGFLGRPRLSAGGPKRPALRLEALDGLRGLAALYVVYFHVIAVASKPYTDALGKVGHLIARSAEHGHDAVVTFIVLSGFVLMLPAARAADGQLPGGLLDYFRRRVKRIIPAYYMALLIVLVLGLAWAIALGARAGQTPTADMPNPFVSDASVGGILSHFVLVQNFSRAWSIALDSPMWSVAVEAQIYVLMPLILLPVWRRFGMVASILVGLLIGMIPVFLLPRGTNFDTSCPWFVGVFALGMAGAVCAQAFSDRSIFSHRRFWAGAATLLLLGVLFIQVGRPHLWWRLGLWTKDMLNGCVIAAFLVFLARCQLDADGETSTVSRILRSKSLLVLGGFSYSLYLVHNPIIDLVELFLPTHLRPARHILALLVIGMAASLIIAYLFSRAFEHNKVLGGWVDGLFEKVGHWLDARRLHQPAPFALPPDREQATIVNQ